MGPRKAKKAKKPAGKARAAKTTRKPKAKAARAPKVKAVIAIGDVVEFVESRSGARHDALVKEIVSVDDPVALVYVSDSAGTGSIEQSSVLHQSIAKKGQDFWRKHGG